MRASPILAALSLLAAARPAWADGPPPSTPSAEAPTVSAADRESARHLMDVGHAHFEKKEFRAALDAYQGADALVHVPTTRLGVGRALLELGRWLEARDVLLQVAAAAVGPGDPPAFQRAKDTAGELAGELDNRLPSIQARIVDAPADIGVSVTIDGTKLPGAAAQLPRRVDPGAHILEANAEGYAPFRQQVTVSERQALVVPVAMKSSNDGGRAPTVGPLGIPWVTWSWGSVGVGATSLLIGGITGGVALSKMSELDVRCPEHNRCSSTVKPLYDEMQTLATASNVLVPLGLLTAAAGIVGLMKFSVPQATAAVRLGPGTVALEGAF
jgi:hypothetical protein